MSWLTLPPFAAQAVDLLVLSFGLSASSLDVGKLLLLTCTVGLSKVSCNPVRVIGRIPIFWLIQQQINMLPASHTLEILQTCVGQRIYVAGALTLFP